MDTEIVKLILDVGSPLIKTVIETFVDKRKATQQKGSNFSPEVYSEYLNITVNHLSTINLIGLKGAPRKLDDIYIPATLYCPFGERKEEYHITSFPSLLFEKNNRILVTDTAGMGKSTLLRVLFLLSFKEIEKMPILIDLRRLNESHSIIDELQNLLLPLHRTIDEKSMIEVFIDGGFLFLLDGFDEIAPQHRAVVTKTIKRFIDKTNKNTFVLTSRPEKELTSLPGFKELRIKPLCKKEAFELIERYDRYGETSKALIRRLEDDVNEGIEEFYSNPLLVSLLFTSFNYKPTVPLKKHLFYRQVYDAIFESHDLAKGESFQHPKHSKLDIDDFEKVLRFLGMHTLFELQKIEYTKDELLKVLSKAKTKWRDLDFKESDFLRDLLTTVPLFLDDAGYVRWAHKSLQEYFCAQYIYVDIQDKEPLLKKLFRSSKIYTFENLIDLYSVIDPIAFEQSFVIELLNDYEKNVIIPLSRETGQTDEEKFRRSILFNSYVMLTLIPGDEFDPQYSSMQQLALDRFALEMDNNSSIYEGDLMLSNREEDILLIQKDRYHYTITKIISRRYPHLFRPVKFKDFDWDDEVLEASDVFEATDQFISRKTRRLMDEKKLETIFLNHPDSIFNSLEIFDLEIRILVFLGSITEYLNYDYALNLLRDIRRKRAESDSIDVFDL